MNKDQLLLKPLNLNDCKGYVTSDGRLYKAIINALEEAINYTLSCERDSELLQELSYGIIAPMKLLSEVFNLANKLAINGYGDEAVKMHQICTQISKKIEKLDNLNK